MNDEILSRIRGQKISRFALVHDSFEIHRVILQLESGPTFEFKPVEFKFGRYESYVLEVDECREKIESIDACFAIQSIGAGWTVGNIEVYERQDWLEPAGPHVKTEGLFATTRQLDVPPLPEKIIGNNPTTHGWGPIGSAPKDASRTVIVIASIVLVSDGRDNEAMVSLADYPGFVSFQTDTREIASVRNEYGGSKDAW